MAGAALLQEREPDAGAGAGQLRGRGLGHLQPAHRLHAAGQLRQYRCSIYSYRYKRTIGEDFTITDNTDTHTLC